MRVCVCVCVCELTPSARGIHPGRLQGKQPVGGSDVLTGLWMSSGQSYGMGFDKFKPDRSAKSKAAKAQFQAGAEPSTQLKKTHSVPLVLYSIDFL